MIRNQRPLVLALVHSLMCLEGAADDDIDPDYAVRALEGIAADVLALDAHDRAELIAELQEIAAREADTESAEFIRTIPSIIGLVSDDD